MQQRSIHRILACLCLCALLSGSFLLPAKAGSFSDVPTGHWARSAIAQCVSQGWLQGVGGGKFGVGQSMTRAGFAAALSRLFGWESSTYYQIFSDVPQSAWYEPALRACYEHGAVTRQDAAFRPDDPITREELAVMLVRALGYGSIAGLAETDTLPFEDVTTNRGHIAMAYEMGFLSGVTQRSFAPEQAATREQAAVVLSRLYDRLHPAAGSEETISILRPGERLAQSAAGETLVLMGGLLNGGQGGLQLLMNQTESITQTKEAHSARHTVLMGISCQGAALSAIARAAAAADELAQAMTDGGYDGLYLDVTRAASGVEGLTALVRDLRKLLPDAALYVSVEAPVRGEEIPNYSALGQAADRVVLRITACQDTTSAFPVLAMEPIERIYYALSVFNDQLADEQLSVMLTTTASSLDKKGRVTALSQSALEEVLATGTSYYSERYACAYAQSEETIAWYLDARSLAARQQLLRCFNAASIGFSSRSGVLFQS